MPSEENSRRLFLAAGRLFEHELNEFKSVAVTRVIHDYYDTDPKRGFYGGGGLDTRYDVYPISYALGALPPDAPSWGAAYKAMLKEYYTRSMFVVAHTTSLPMERNSITLDANTKDEWGLPAMRVTYKDHPDDLKIEKFFLDRGMELLEAAGARKKWAYPVREQSFGFHLLGTCRMGNDPKKSVVNKYHQAHDLGNLFICDGSSFVTSGRGQPTCTIQALAYRAADHIIRMAKSGEIKSG
jgi:choline dehydrogenase-like flavoprotein